MTNDELMYLMCGIVGFFVSWVLIIEAWKYESMPPNGWTIALALFIVAVIISEIFYWTDKKRPSIEQMKELNEFVTGIKVHSFLYANIMILIMSIIYAISRGFFRMTSKSRIDFIVSTLKGIGTVILFALLVVVIMALIVGWWDWNKKKYKVK